MPEILHRTRQESVATRCKITKTLSIVVQLRSVAAMYATGLIINHALIECTTRASLSNIHCYPFTRKLAVGLRVTCPFLMAVIAHYMHILHYFNFKLHGALAAEHRYRYSFWSDRITVFFVLINSPQALAVRERSSELLSSLQKYILSILLQYRIRAGNWRHDALAHHRPRKMFFFLFKSHSSARASFGSLHTGTYHATYTFAPSTQCVTRPCRCSYPSWTVH